MEVAAEHPNKGSSALSSIVELPRNQIRTWVDSGGKPDVAHGVHIAQDQGWLDADVESERFDALNTLVAAVFSGGTISERFEPAFTPDRESVTFARVNDALDRLGCGTKLRGDDEDPDRPVEVLPDTNASVLGRVLVALAHRTARRPMKPISRSPTTSTTLPSTLRGTSSRCTSGTGASGQGTERRSGLSSSGPSSSGEGLGR